MTVVIICNTYFANEFSLYNYLMRENVTFLYLNPRRRSMKRRALPRVTELVLIGEPPEFPLSVTPAHRGMNLLCPETC